MRELFGNFFKLVFVLVLAYGIARVGFHYYVIDQLKDMTNKLAAYVVISYTELETDVDGSIDVSGIEITPLGLDQSVSIARMRTSGPGVLEIAREYLPLIGKGNPPAYGRVHFSDISIPLKGELGEYLDEGMRNSKSAPDQCAAGGIISVAMARSLGLDALHADADANYRYDLSGNRLSGSASIAIRDMQSFGLDFYLANIAPTLFSAESQQMPSIISMAATYRLEPSYGLKIASHCAGKNKISVADYKLLLADQFLRQQRNLGITFGWGLETAVRKFFRDWGEVELEMKPENPVNPVGLALLSPEKMLESLGLELTLNSELITDLSVSLGEAKGKGVSSLLFPKTKKKVNLKKRRVVYRMVYREVPIGDISHYVNRLVRMRAEEGPVRHGALISIDGDTAQLDQRQPGGQFSSFVDLDEVDHIEVLFREPVAPVSTTPES